MRSKGFTLLEMMMAVSILAIVGLLGLIVISSSAESAELAQAKAEVQAGLRDVMAAIMDAVREAYTDRTVAVSPPRSPVNVESIQTSESNDRITFHVPVRVAGTAIVRGSTPITIQFENEDANGNALLDSGEDLNGDGTLNRRVLRMQDGQTQVLGASNNISNLRFELQPNQNARDNLLTSLYVWLEASRRYGPGMKHLVRAELAAVIDLKN